MAVYNTEECPKLLQDFLIYMQTVRGRSERTVIAYYTDLRLFLRYFNASKNGLPMTEPNLSDVPIALLTDEFIASATMYDAYKFLNYVQTSNNNIAKTRARKVSSLRGFYKYITVKAGLCKINPMENLEGPSIKKTLPKYLTLDESLRLLSVVNGKYFERDYCILTLFLNCGMRVSELTGIKKESIRDNTLVLLGKGNKERQIYLNEACMDAINKYLAVRPEPAKQQYSSCFFLSKNNTSLTPRRVEQIVENYLKLAGLEGRGFSPHKLRHTAATLMYQYGNVDVNVLKNILGHENLDTTEIYTHVSDRQMEEASSKNPLASVKSSGKGNNGESPSLPSAEKNQK